MLIVWDGHDQPCIVLVVNSLWPNDTIWWHKSGSTLAQVMACCLMAPSHYLNHCWLIFSKVQWHPSESNFTRDTSAISHFKISWKIIYLKFCSNLPGANELSKHYGCITLVWHQGCQVPPKPPFSIDVVLTLSETMQHCCELSREQTPNSLKSWPMQAVSRQFANGFPV